MHTCESQPIYVPRESPSSTTAVPRTSPENLLGAIFSAKMATLSVLHGLSNITKQRSTACYVREARSLQY